MHDLHVIDDPAAAAAALGPVRSRLLSELTEPASAAALGCAARAPRVRRINYHLRALEAHGLIRVAETRQWGGLTERLLVRSAASYVVSQTALGPGATHPTHEVDRLSASYLVALGARIVREVGDLLRRAKAANKRLATLAIDTEIRFPVRRRSRGVHPRPYRRGRATRVALSRRVRHCRPRASHWSSSRTRCPPESTTKEKA